MILLDSRVTAPCGVHRGALSCVADVGHTGGHQFESLSGSWLDTAS